MTGKSLDINHKPQRTALVVDDELSNRIILRSILKRFGYSVLEAKSGQEGVEIFSNHDLDVVFMDVLMPEMDGYDATINIKKLAGDRFVPVIFLTALTEEDALVRCIEVGGDDFLTKPFSHAILHSKLRALERIRSLHVEVDRLYGRMRLEEEIAKKVFNTAVLGNNVAMDLIPHRMQSAAIFSGDLLLTAWAPSGDLNVLLGDFTGHGLSAALGALPMAAVFRAMTDKGFAPERILATMNEELHNLLPAGMFLA
ncbi:histidine kinase, partial [Achromatium sp. WMS2]